MASGAWPTVAPVESVCDWSEVIWVMVAVLWVDAVEDDIADWLRWGWSDIRNGYDWTEASEMPESREADARRRVGALSSRRRAMIGEPSPVSGVRPVMVSNRAAGATAAGMGLFDGSRVSAKRARCRMSVLSGVSATVGARRARPGGGVAGRPPNVAHSGGTVGSGVPFAVSVPKVYCRRFAGRVKSVVTGGMAPPPFRFGSDAATSFKAFRRPYSIRPPMMAADATKAETTPATTVLVCGALSDPSSLLGCAVAEGVYTSTVVLVGA